MKSNNRFIHEMKMSGALITGPGIGFKVYDTEASGLACWQ